LFNNFLTIVVVVLGLYLAVLPILPNVELFIANATDSTDGVHYVGQLADELDVVSEDLAVAPTENRLVIPGIHLDEEVFNSADSAILSLGPWRRPHTSTPDMGGNTVIVGHRFSYSDPATFFHLDKVKIGDNFGIWWEGQEYLYKVFQTKIVDPSYIQIEAPTDFPIVTIYTCTPVWTATQRLVVRGTLIPS